MDEMEDPDEAMAVVAWVECGLDEPVIDGLFGWWGEACIMCGTVLGVALPLLVNGMLLCNTNWYYTCAFYLCHTF